MLDTQKKVVTIGGGTGTFVVLSGLKRIPNVELTAIVSVLDDGGSTGRLRDAYGILPPGDARQALVALAEGGNGESLMRDLFNYRFSKGDIAGHNFGNLFLTALSDITGSEASALEEASRILRVRGHVIPVSGTPGTLVATLENGEKVVGEHAIDTRTPGRSPIAKLETKENVMASAEAVGAIAAADAIILGPGDLYASTLANFAIGGLTEAVKKSKAKLIYIVNLFTKAGETDGYSARKHVEEVARYAGRHPDAVLVHAGKFEQSVLSLYEKEHEFPVEDDLGEGASIFRRSFADVTVAGKIEGDAVTRSLIRHNSEKLGDAIREII